MDLTLTLTLRLYPSDVACAPSLQLHVGFNLSHDMATMLAMISDGVCGLSVEDDLSALASIVCKCFSLP